MRVLPFGLSILSLLAACSRAPAEPRHTVEEYRADAALRRAQMERCQRDPGAIRRTPDCINAQTAAAFEDRLRLQDAPPVGLQKGKDLEKPASDRDQE